MSNFDIGKQVRLKGEFTDPNDSDAPIDPTTITVKYKQPGGALVTHVFGVDAEVIKSGTGVYYEDVTLTASGNFTFKWFGTGNAVAAEEAGFNIAAEITA